MEINLKIASSYGCGCSLWTGPIEGPEDEQGVFLRTCGTPSACRTAMHMIDKMTEQWSEITVIRAEKMDDITRLS